MVNRESCIVNQPMPDYSLLAIRDLLFQCGYQAVSEMPTAVPCRKGDLSTLPGPIQVEPGKLIESGLPRRHDPAACRDDPVLVFSFSWCLF
jgi:hypothetical protein